MGTVLVVLDADGVGGDGDVVVEGQLGELGVLAGDLHVQSCGVFDREGVEVQFAQDVYVLIVDFSEGYGQLLLGLTHPKLYQHHINFTIRLSRH